MRTARVLLWSAPIGLLAACGAGPADSPDDSASTQSSAPTPAVTQDPAAQQPATGQGGQAVPPAPPVDVAMANFLDAKAKFDAAAAVEAENPDTSVGWSPFGKPSDMLQQPFADYVAAFKALTQAQRKTVDPGLEQYWEDQQAGDKAIADAVDNVTTFYASLDEYLALKTDWANLSSAEQAALGPICDPTNGALITRRL